MKAIAVLLSGSVRCEESDLAATIQHLIDIGLDVQRAYRDGDTYIIDVIKTEKFKEDE